jgi:hypothetical protein
MRRIVVACALPLLFSGAACQRTVRTPSPVVVTDSVTGIVSITGTGFEQQIVLRSGNTVIQLSANAADSAALSRLGGVQVIASGTRAGIGMRVDHFTATRVAGAAVVDGVIREAGDRLVLETARGLIPLGNPPAPLRKMIGARVWIGGPLDTGPNTYGIIVPAQ